MAICTQALAYCTVATAITVAQCTDRFDNFLPNGPRIDPLR